MQYEIIWTTHLTIASNTWEYPLKDNDIKTPPFGDSPPGSASSSFKRTDWAGRWKRYRR